MNECSPTLFPPCYYIPTKGVTDRLSQNAATLRYLQKCHAEVLSSLRSAQTETTTLKQNLAQLNARAQTEHANLEQARSKLEDALYVNAHLREENEMIKTDDERWAFQVKDREEQLESLSELLVKLEKQQAEIDERKRLEEAEMVRRLEEERAEVVRLNMLAERERLTSGGNGGNASGAGADAVEVEGMMPILPRGSGEMSSMLALAPEWTPMASAGGGGGTSLSEAIAIEPNIHNTSGSNSAATSVILNTSSVSADGGVVGGGNDAASTVSALTTDM